MIDATTIVVSVIGAAVGIIGALGLMLRILATSIAREFDASARRMEDLKTSLNARIDDAAGRIDSISDRIAALTTEMHQRFDQLNRELGENRERMAKLEGALEGFLAGRRDAA